MDGNAISPFRGALFLLGLASAVAFLPGTLVPGISLRWAVLAALVPLCLLLSTARSGDAGRVAAGALALLAFAALSLSWTSSVLGGLDELIHLVILAGAVWLGTETEDARPLWLGACWGVAISAVLVFSQTLGWSPVEQAVAPAGLFINKNVAGEAALVGLIAAALNGWWAFAALFVLAVLVTGSKAVLGALMIAVAYWIAPRFRAAAWALAIVAAVGFCLAFAGLSQSGLVRLAIWDDALAASGFFGNGIGSYAADFPAAFYAHSEPIQALYELGVPGLAALGALFVLTVWRRDASVEGEQAIIVGLGAASVLAFTFHMPFTAFAAAFAAGRVLGARLLVRGGERAGGASGAAHA